LGFSSSALSLPSPFLSSVSNSALALAISLESMTPSLLVSSALMMGGSGNLPPPGGPPGPPVGLAPSR